MLSPIGVRGSRLEYGSWKMICIRRRYGLRAAPLSFVMSVAVEPDRAGRRLDEAQQQPPDRRLAAARLADQARASRRGGSSKLDAVDRLDHRRPSRCRIPPRIGKCLTRSRTSTSGGRRRSAPRSGGAGRPGADRRLVSGAAVTDRRHRGQPATSGRGIGRSPWRRGRASSGRRGPAATGRSSGWTSVARRRRPPRSRVRQRGANRQPCGRSMRLGTLPGMTASSSLTSPTTGIEPMRPCV